MESILEYLTKKHERLADGNNGKCSAIALETAIFLMDEGYDPEILRAELPKKDEVKPEPRMIAPIRYPNIEWLFHDVCAVGSIVFDPIVGKPISIQKYPFEVFGRWVPMYPRVTTKTIREVFDGVKPYLA